MRKTWHGVRAVVQAPMDLMYGFRPRDPSLWYLSPYEFHVWWKAVSVSPPHVHIAMRNLGSLVEGHSESMRVCMSEWTEEGFAYYAAMREANAPVVPTAGKHYVVKEHPAKAWLTLPALPELKTLPHRWVLVRRPKPMVPVFRKLKLPSARHSSE